MPVDALCWLDVYVWKEYKASNLLNLEAIAWQTLRNQFYEALTKIKYSLDLAIFKGVLYRGSEVLRPLLFAFGGYHELSWEL